MKADYTNYIKAQVNFKEKWFEYCAQAPNFGKKNYQEALVPLYGTPEFNLLSLAEREKFFLEYVKFVAEALVLFEQLLVLGIWKIKNGNYQIEPEAKLALDQVALEELYHSHGFRHFLAIHKELNWADNKIYANAKIMRIIISKVVIWSPSSVFLPGAKLEAFTLSYHKMIKKYYPNPRENSWIHLSQIHQIDETYHLPLEFSFHDSVIESVGVFKTLLGGMLFVLTLQLALMIGSFKVVHYSFPHYSFFKKLMWTGKMAKWAVRTTPSYADARIITKKQFALRKPRYGKIMSFIHW